MIHKVFEASDETILKRGYLALRSMNGLNQYEIQLPSDAVAKMRQDWPIAILNNGETQAYLLGNAFRGQISGRLDGYEAEVHQELNRTMPVTPRGVVFPNMLLQQRTTMNTSNIANVT